MLENSIAISIYAIENEIKSLLPEKIEESKSLRQSIGPIFEKMKLLAEEGMLRYPVGHGHYQACQYFLNQYIGITACLKDPHLPLDNNHSERGLRKYVIGRKTWFGTHSEKGPETTAIHFKKTLFTPYQYKWANLHPNPIDRDDF